MRKIVYTCITGSYDELREPLIITPNWEYVCFTNNKELLKKENIGVYKIYPTINHYNLDPVRLARQCKILGVGVNDADIFIWHDANLQINCNLDDLINKYWSIDVDLVLARHPKRNCLYDEAVKCIKLKKDNEGVILSQIGRYSGEKFPYDRNLYETGVLIRRKLELTNLFYYEWFKEVRNYSRRDQISLPYCLWKYSDFAPRINAVGSKELRSNFVKIKHLTSEFGGKV